MERQIEEADHEGSHQPAIRFHQGRGRVRGIGAGVVTGAAKGQALGLTSPPVTIVAHIVELAPQEFADLSHPAIWASRAAVTRGPSPVALGSRPLWGFVRKRIDGLGTRRYLFSNGRIARGGLVRTKGNAPPPLSPLILERFSLRPF